MKVICTGMPNTGTKSIAKALRHLGLTAFHWEEQTSLGQCFRNFHQASEASLPEC